MPTAWTEMETALPMHSCKLCLRARAAVALVGVAGGAAAGMVEAGRGFESLGAHRPRGGKIRFLRQMARVGIGREARVVVASDDRQKPYR